MLRAVLILMTPGPWLEAQVPRATVFARLRSGNVVEIIDPATGRGRPVYHSPRWATRDVSVSPDGGLLGLIEVEEGRLEGSQYRVPPSPSSSCWTLPGPSSGEWPRVFRATCGAATVAWSTSSVNTAKETLPSFPKVPLHTTWPAPVPHRFRVRSAQWT